MKTLFFLTACLMIAIPVFSQDCLHQGIGLYTQEQVDRFPDLYPNCKEIVGDVIISGNDIMYLDGLGGVETIGGNLDIINTARLFGVDGLHNLRSIQGHFDFYYNAQLTNLSGLDSLTTIGQDLEIYNNPMLDSLTGLGGLTTVGRNLWIGSNPVLLNLAGIRSLVSVGGIIQVDYNDILRDISDLGTLKTIKGAIYINSNPRLMKLFGLDSINAGTIGGLTVTNNARLSSCDVLSICRYLVIPYRNIHINNNASGCNSEAEVKAGCDTLAVENQGGAGNVYFYPNPAFSRINIEIPGPSAGTHLTILNLNGEEMMSRIVSPPVDRVDVSSLSPGIYIVKLVSEGSATVSKLVKKQE